MRKLKPPASFKPTRACPHPACRTLHAVVLCAGLVFIATQFVAMDGWRLLISLVSTCAALAILRAVSWRGWSMRNVDAVDDRPLTPWHTVDPRWATAAAAVDALLAVGGVLVVVVSPATRRGTSELPSAAQSLVVLAVSVLVVGFRSYAHFRATRPRQPRAARAGWFSRRAASSPT